MCADQLNAINQEAATITAWTSPAFETNALEVDVLRLDKIHPVVSGNKWFKLKYHLIHALNGKYTTLVTWGGAWSNHLLATAFAARAVSLESIGLVRGEPSEKPSATLREAADYGMQLQFVSRENYRKKESMAASPHWRLQYPGAYFIPEGAADETGINGCREMLNGVNKDRYTHIVCALGTGTMLLGLAMEAGSEQHLIGIPVLKGINGIPAWHELPPEWKSRLKMPEIISGYHFGGYARKTDELIGFMNEVFDENAIPLDFVYTAKLFFAVKDLSLRGHFATGSRILVIHSGGLQGNDSLPPGTLHY